MKVSSVVSFALMILINGRYEGRRGKSSSSRFPRKVSLIDVSVFVYFVLIAGLWVLPVNPFSQDRLTSIPWFIVGVFGVFLLPFCRDKWRSSWKSAVLLWGAAVSLSLLFGSSVLPLNPFAMAAPERSQLLGQVIQFTPVIVVVLMVLLSAYPRAAITAFALVFSAVGPATVLFIRPDIAYGLGQYLRFSDPEYALMPSLGLAFVSAAWVMRLLPNPLIFVLVSSNLLTFLFLAPLVNSLMAGIFSLLVSAFFVLRQRPNRLGRGTSAIIAVLPLLAAIISYTSGGFRSTVSTFFGKNETFSGRQQIWEENMRVVFSEPLKIRIPLDESRPRYSHSLYIDALLLGGVVMGTLLIFTLVAAMYWVARNRTRYAALMVWICMYGIAGAFSMTIDSEGLWIWIILAIVLLGQDLAKGKKLQKLNGPLGASAVGKR